MTMKHDSDPKHTNKTIKVCLRIKEWENSSHGVNSRYQKDNASWELENTHFGAIFCFLWVTKKKEKQCDEV